MTPRLPPAKSERPPLTNGSDDCSRVRCGPWQLQDNGIHVCSQCGRLDPLDFLEEFADD